MKRHDHEFLIDEVRKHFILNRQNAADLIAHAPIGPEMTAEEALSAALGYIRDNTFAGPIYGIGGGEFPSVTLNNPPAKPGEIRKIGAIGNYCGRLSVKTEGGVFYWAIENYDGYDWEEIPGYLYNALNKFQKSKP